MTKNDEVLSILGAVGQRVDDTSVDFVWGLLEETPYEKIIAALQLRKEKTLGLHSLAYYTHPNYVRWFSAKERRKTSKKAQKRSQEAGVGVSTAQ